MLRLLFFWILQAWIPSALTWNDWAAANAAKILSVIMAAMTASAICAGITFIMTLEKVRSNAKNMSYKVMVQIVKIITWCTTCIVIISILMDKSPVFILSGLGALTAVLMLIFKDSIVGLVAGIQVAQNDMVRVGDWITMPKFNADGNVIDIALTTVKVQNFDNTVTMIPSSALISDSFINWRYMSDSKGRRIKRPVWISATSIREMTAELKKNFVEQNLMLESDNHISNLAAFETWLLRMLEKNDDITKELTCMVRQTEPSDTGIPVEIYAFTKTRDWVKYENIQTEIFDLIYVTAPKFGLQIYQRTGDKYLPNQL
ncbi:MAG: mechanosensitive ion channel [Kiritimatiellae bacterium]|nr:mechanosensitive ion channel [Kiritimatiellia bacterium]